MSVSVRVPVVGSSVPSEKVIEHPTGASVFVIEGPDYAIEVRDADRNRLAVYAPGCWLSAEVKQG